MPALPSDAQVIGAVQRAPARRSSRCHAAGGLPGEMHKLWPADAPGSYHMEYGFSCMGYEIAGGLGVKMARPEQRRRRDGRRRLLSDAEFRDRDLGDAGQEAHRRLLDNRGYGCINRLQMATGGANFNNLLKDAQHHAARDRLRRACQSLGAIAKRSASIAELERPSKRSRENGRTT
jgi:3D-(3,5/4)-trihydroxycyclohexane-1,2-dione acylhydrolase (decyclizing)